MLALLRVGGTGDHTPAVLGYAHAAMRLPIGTRLTAGGWMASSNYAGSDVERGGLFALEQPIASKLTFAADWYTGNSGLGYASPGLIITQSYTATWGAISGFSSIDTFDGFNVEFNAAPPDRMTARLTFRRIRSVPAVRRRLPARPGATAP